MTISKRRLCRLARQNLFLLSVLAGVLVGFGIGVALRRSSWNGTDAVLWFKLPGILFMRALKLLTVPLVFVGVLAASASLSARTNLRIGLVCLGLTALTHVLATLTGVLGSLALAAIIRTERNSTAQLILDGSSATVVPQKSGYDIVADILRALVPGNIIQASMSQEITRFKLEPAASIQQFDKNASSGKWQKKVEVIDGTNMLGLLSFAMLLGLAASALEDRAVLLRELFRALNDLIIVVLGWLVTLAPIGIASLLVDAVLSVSDLGSHLRSLGLFAAICTLTLVLYALIVLSALVLLVLARSRHLHQHHHRLTFGPTYVARLYVQFAEAAVLAFASTSGAVCAHKSMQICEERLRMDARMSRFSIPLYTALQADGSAIFITIACSFLALIDGGNTLSSTDFIVVCLMTGVLCLSLPSVPSSSIVTILVVLSAVGRGHLNIGVLYTVEWLLDRVRTAVNVYSHCFCTVITNELCANDLDTLVNNNNVIRVDSGVESTLSKGQADLEMNKFTTSSSETKLLKKEDVLNDENDGDDDEEDDEENRQTSGAVKIMVY